MNYKDIQVAYVGGGSRAWFRDFMFNMSVQDKFCGKIRLYDIDYEAAKINTIIGSKINEHVNAKSKWTYEAAKCLEDALKGADFVIISITPGTFDEMESDVHAPEKYGIYQSVGDTVGPGGILRTMRTIPMFEVIGNAILQHCPDAHVLNFTNPMTMCTRTLTGISSKIKAMGYCHEVYLVQDFLCQVIDKIMGIKGVTRREIDVDVMGVNHFTWFTRAEYDGQDLFPIYREYIGKYNYDQRTDEEKSIIWSCANLVKMDLFKRYGQIAAAGDRHLSEFINGRWYMDSPEMVKEWGYFLTPVSYRKNELIERRALTNDYVTGKKSLPVRASAEDFPRVITGLLGLHDCVNNINIANAGQMKGFPMGAVVETNALFTRGNVRPLSGVALNPEVATLVGKVVAQQENLYHAVTRRDLNAVFNIFMNEPNCAKLSLSQGAELFDTMITNTKSYLQDWDI